MIKKHFLFLLFRIKSDLYLLPKLILCTIVIGLIVFAAGYSGTRALDCSDDSFINIRIAAVYSDDDAKINLGFQMLENMDSISNICTFIKSDYDSALSMLRSGDVSAIAVIPEGFVDSIQNGTNTPATLILPENPGIDTLFFCSVIDSGSHTLAYVQSGIYAVDELLWHYELYDYVGAAEDALNNLYIKYALNRSECFDGETITATGNISSRDFYICSGIVLIILLSGLTLSDAFSVHTKKNDAALRYFGISFVFNRLCEVISLTLIIFALSFWICIPFGFSLASLLSLITVVFSCVSLMMFICSLSDNCAISGIIIFILSIFMLYISGRLLPQAWLPDIFSKVAYFLPVKYYCSSLEYGLILKNTNLDISYSAIWGAVFLLSGSVITSIRGGVK